ncbi:MAG: (d)CMP kinase [Bdellovibrionales bacterium]|nr:(d)CMP kinase [Bdellovibrionales bacterium]
MNLQVVTIDGPAASGKSSVSRELAREMGWRWVSTGAFYRGLAYVAQATGVDIGSEEALSRLAHSSIWEVQLGEDRTKVFLNGNDVTENIYREEVGTAASQLSLYPKVRASLLAAQRACANASSWLVAEGRDCGTVVFPEAPLKIYLTARSEARAQRRAAEEGSSLEEMQRVQAERDKQDTTRKAAPLQIPENAHVIDTSSMELNEVVDAVKALVETSLQL